MAVTAEKASAFAFCPVDADGAPLTADGERWVEVRPGVWYHPLAVAFLALCESVAG